jgi:hypothetical protein
LLAIEDVTEAQFLRQEQQNAIEVLQLEPAAKRHVLPTKKESSWASSKQLAFD